MVWTNEDASGQLTQIPGDVASFYGLSTARPDPPLSAAAARIQLLPGCFAVGSGWATAGRTTEADLANRWLAQGPTYYRPKILVGSGCLTTLKLTGTSLTGLLTARRTRRKRQLATWPRPKLPATHHRELPLAPLDEQDPARKLELCGFKGLTNSNAVRNRRPLCRTEELLLPDADEQGWRPRKPLRLLRTWRTQLDPTSTARRVTGLLDNAKETARRKLRQLRPVARRFSTRSSARRETTSRQEGRFIRLDAGRQLPVERGSEEQDAFRSGFVTAIDESVAGRDQTGSIRR